MNFWSLHVGEIDRIVSDKSTNIKKYKVGYRVLVRKSFDVKHKPLYEGPFEIVGVEDPNLFVKKSNYIDEVHINRTIPFE